MSFELGAEMSKQWHLTHWGPLVTCGSGKWFNY